MRLLSSTVLVVALAATALGGALAQDSPAPANTSAASPISRLSWLVGDWNCAATAESSDRGHVIHNHVTLLEKGDGFQFATTLDDDPHVTQETLQYDAERSQWYDRSSDETTGRQELVGDANALTEHSLTLFGLLEIRGEAIRVRSTYTWSSKDAYRFTGAALTTEGTWQPIEIHDCQRKTVINT